jgi:predicted DCC family thiol-disulfide oxidoreductase YuxK
MPSADFQSKASIILFDGLCNLCNGAIQFIIPRDPQANFYFASLQSAVGQAILHQYGLSQQSPDSVVFVQSGHVYTKSTAILHIARRLHGFWFLAVVGFVVPNSLRDRLYDFVASHRYRWFGQRDVCLLPTHEIQCRFLDVTESQLPHGE